MSRRKDAKALARWEDETRRWATATGRNLALDVYYDRETATKPHGGRRRARRGREGVGLGFWRHKRTAFRACDPVLARDLRSSGGTARRRPASRLRVGECRRRTSQLNSWSRGGESRPRRTTDAGLVRPRDRPDGGRCRLSSLRSSGHDRPSGLSPSSLRTRRLRGRHGSDAQARRKIVNPLTPSTNASCRTCSVNFLMIFATSIHHQLHPSLIGSSHGKTKGV
jgi:hypothetical protein